MRETDWNTALGAAYRLALGYLTALPGRPVGVRTGPAAMRAALGGPVPVRPTPPADVIDELAAAADPGLVGTGSGRFFGFVIGGATPAALAADWLASAWDQNAGLYATSPAAAAVEEIAGAWLVELLGLPRHASFGFVTGAQMANLTALAAARHEVLRRAGWDVETRGLVGAPPVRVLAGADRHGSIDRALRFLGLGTGAIVEVPADEQGAMRVDALRTALSSAGGPVIVCAQAGNVNSGAIDPLAAIVDLAHAAGAWVHVDGAFGLWGMASPSRRPLLDGVERADSWATDAHKWLNVPYDSGLVFCAHPAAHRAAMGLRAAYLVHSDEDRDPLDYTPEFSRRARGFAVYAALRALGRGGLADLVDRCCALARRFADQLATADGVTVLNDVVLNQVLVRFDGPDERTRSILDAVRTEGTCFVSGTTWQGRAAMRISVSNWTTDESDVDASVRAILKLADGRREGHPRLTGFHKK